MFKSKPKTLNKTLKFADVAIQHTFYSTKSGLTFCKLLRPSLTGFCLFSPPYTGLSNLVPVISDIAFL